MNNVEQPFVAVPLELIGGLYTEATPETLPLGASPRVINCDFILGSNLQRPGKQSAFQYYGSYLTKATKHASTQPGAFAPNEDPWTTPSNATLNTPGTYATATLNFAGGGASALDQQTTAASAGAPFNVGPLTPTFPDEWAFFVEVSEQTSFNTGPFPGTWTNIFGPTGAELAYVQGLTSTAPFTATGTWSAGAPNWCAILALFFTNGSSPALAQTNHVSIAGADSIGVTLPGNTTPGNTLIIFAGGYMSTGQTTPTSPTITDSQGNTFTHINQAFYPGRSLHFCTQVDAWVVGVTQNAGETVTIHGLGTLFESGVLYVGEVTNLVAPAPTPDVTQQLQCINYGYSINPAVIPLGFTVSVFGNQTTQTDSQVYIQVGVLNGTSASPTFTGMLPASDGNALTLGTPLQNWGLQLTPALVNSPNFGVYVVAYATDGTVQTFNIYSVEINLYLSPDPPPSFNYLKTFAETGGEVLNMALGSDGVFYQEDAINNPTVLSTVYTEIQPNSFAQSATVDDREFIAISNLQNGTDIPLTYTPPNFDRLTQVGPGAPPSCTATTSGSAIATIEQQAPFTIPSHASGPYSSFIDVSAGTTAIGTFGAASTPGNVCFIVLNKNVALPTYTLNGKTMQVFEVGTNFVITGCPTINGNVVNNDPTGVNAPPYYTVTAVGQPITGQTYYDAIQFTVTFTTFGGANTLGNNGVPAGIKIQSTLATMVTAVQVPNLEVGDQFEDSGTGGAPPAGYDGSWQVTATPNASNLTITSTQLLNNVATYGFAIETGSNPAVGQAVTVQQTLNGNGIFNVAQAIITAVVGGTFSISLPGPNISAVGESGTGLIFGTIFQFDPLQIVGNVLGGTIASTGTIATGQRMCCYSFLTRNGFVTKPSPVFTFDIVGGVSQLAVANLLTGPSNVIARIIHFTPANGGQFYNIENPVTVLVNGVSTTFSSTYVNDNVSTNVLLNFTDSILTAGQEIDIEGYNLFENYELGSCTAIIPYAQRIFVVGEQNKVFNLLNYSFDGGVQVTQSQGGSQSTYPAGWTLDPTYGGGIAVVNSPIFGSALQIYNQTGSTQAAYGRIAQNAYQDEDMVPIINASTTYSIRVTASNPTANNTGALIVDLWSTSLNRTVGIFSVQLVNMTTSMAIYTGTLLTTVLAPVPNDLQIRIWVEAMANGAEIQIDRIEPFPTEAPNLNTQVIGSYQNEYEQFDRITGVILGTQQNQQPITSGFTFGSGSLYLLKTGSLLAVNDNPATEPSYWNVPRVVSPSVGGPGPYCVTSSIDEANSGEQWSVIVGQAGAFLFQGQQPIKLSEEIQSVISQINWAYGYTMWVKNDIKNRRILWGVPLNELNALGQSPFWLPSGVIANGTNPTTPNVIIEMNYKQLNTAGAVEESVQIHRSYSGKLIASDIVRKWSIWTIKAPCAAFLQRADTTSPLFVGNSDHNAKIFQLVDGLLQDDGAAIDQIYFTAGFVPSETGQGLQIGLVRYTFEYMTMILNGTGPIAITAYPNSLATPYALPLLPNLTQPISTNGDVEIPINEVGSRCFLGFECNAVGAGFQLARVVMSMVKDPWSPVRGWNG